MHPTIRQVFESILSTRASGAQSVLEVGAVPNEDTLLCLPTLAKARERIGVNIDGPRVYRGFEIVKCNANNMECFEADRFDVVLCNATLEHDAMFWRTLDEMRRVLKKGGLAVIGVPGYVRLRGEGYKSPLRSVLRHLPACVKPTRTLELLLSLTITFEVHNQPGDYYRFSEQAVREVFFRGMHEVEVRSVMVPPRIVGAGRKAP
jgi:SAM-dependent methyltransferase